MSKNNLILCLLLTLTVVAGSGCTGLSSLGTAARAGDSIVVSLGWQQDLTRNDIKVVIEDGVATQFILPPGDPAVRALWQSYPDPVSNLIVGGETGQANIDGSFAGLATTLIDNAATDFDKDYSQTFMIIDLPPGMALGPATISFTDPLNVPLAKPTVGGGDIAPMMVEIVATGGSPDTFQTQDAIVVVNGYLKAMERSTHYTVTLQGAPVPYGVHLKFTHDPDLDNSGVGRAYVSNPRGDLKSINWRDDGYNLDVIMMPARTQVLADIKQFKFYVAGGITGLSLLSTEAYDENGVPVPGIAASIN